MVLVVYGSRGVVVVEMVVEVYGSSGNGGNGGSVGA